MDLSTEVHFSGRRAISHFNINRFLHSHTQMNAAIHNTDSVSSILPGDSEHKFALKVSELSAENLGSVDLMV